MSSQVFWVVADHVLYIAQEQRLTLDMIRSITREVADHIEAAQQRAPENVIIGIVDMRRARTDLIVRALASARIHRIFEVVDPRVWAFKPGFTVLITSSDSVSTLVSMIIRISHQPMTTVATLDEALAIIKNMYPELAPHLDSYAHKD